MTYYSSSYYTNWEITAFTESDLVSGNLSCGSTFKMPANASVCITVKDNDSSLSGDGCYDDQAADGSGQQASIEGNGTEIGNGGQIYAESYYWVKDQYGNWYVLIEIEQEGTNSDYFTFYTGGGYKVPPAGAELTVYSQCNVSGDWLKYTNMGAGECAPPTGEISGTVFCDTNCDGINGLITTIPGCDYRIEAEKMYDCGFSTYYSTTASGGKAVKLNCAGGYGELATCFSGKTGTYDVKVSVQDENDGQSVIKLLVGGKYVEAIKLDKDTDGAGNDNGAYSTYVIKNVAIKDGETIKLAVWGGGGEYVRIDKIDLEGHDKTVINNEPVKAGVVVKLLALDGTVIATTTTDANGNYKFDDVPVGQYKIMGVAPDGTHFTIQDVDGNTKDHIDSDVDANGLSGVVTVTADGKADIDLGVCEVELGSLSGRYFCDTNDDNQDDGNGNEPAIAGVRVQLILAGAVIAETFTDANGEYSFGDLEPGTYSVRFTDPNGVLAGKQLVDANVGPDASDSDAIGDTTLSEINGIIVVAGQDTPDNDAGAEYILGSLSGRYFCDENNNDVDDGEPGIAGVIVELLDAAGNGTGVTTTTAADGSYSFTNLLPGTYGVKFTDAVSGKTLVNPNVGADDTIDSDAIDLGGGMSQITGIVVVGGQDTPDNDAGVEDPGTASVGDTVWFDANRNGVLDGGEAGVDGVEVKLFADLDNNGSAETLVATTTTAGGGKYLFSGLNAGTYAVMFGTVAGLEFTTLSAAAADAANNDSDAGVGGMTGTFEISIGEAERDIDAGLVTEDPTANDDDAETCADETVTVDVLANDSAVLGGTLSITAVDGQAISEGNSVVTAAGTIVTLVGGQLVVDGETAYAALDIGEKASEAISYTVTDSNGGSATANLDVTFCGDANSVDSFYAALPTSMTYQIDYAVDQGAPFPAFAFDFLIVDANDDRFDGVKIEEAYCLDFNTAIRTIAESAQVNTGAVFGSQSAAALGAFDQNTVSHFNGQAGGQNLDLINWIVAQGFEGQGYSGWEVQFAIWELADNFNASLVNYANFQDTSLSDVQDILSQAALHDGFVFAPGDTVGMVVDPGTSDPQNQQPFILALNWETYDCLC